MQQLSIKWEVMRLVVIQFDVKLRNTKNSKTYGVISVLQNLFPIRLLCVDYETGDLLSFYADDCICLNIKKEKVKV